MIYHLAKLAGAALISSLLLFTSAAQADGRGAYEVTITNVTHSINFTPILVASHRRPVSIFEPGSSATEELAAIAEAGDTSLLEQTLKNNRHVIDIGNSGGLLMPGDSVSVVVSAAKGAKYISLVAMMLPTNDGFIGLNSVRAPWHGVDSYLSPGYDAGTEPNDEWCRNIPGPTCGGVGLSPEPDPQDEGYVHVHRGIHGVGELNPAVYDWRNPVARITIRRIRHRED